MGDVIKLGTRRLTGQLLEHSDGVEAQFFFDLACPFSYLVAERVMRAFDRVIWSPVARRAVIGPSDSTVDEQDIEFRAVAEQRATELHLPLVWPENFPAPVPGALRAATFAADYGRGSAFVLAASRLAFAGGFDLESPEVLAEAAAAAALPLVPCLCAARDDTRDGIIDEAEEVLLAVGTRQLPALYVHQRLFSGDEEISAALSERSVPGER